jgi:hypothetical protein
MASSVASGYYGSLALTLAVPFLLDPPADAGEFCF